MSDKVHVALDKMAQGFSCAQSVLYAFCGDLQLDPDIALKVSGGFGGGMGRKGEVCGAATGGIIAIGMKYGIGENQDSTAKDRIYQKTRELMDRFERERGSYLCRQLLEGCDLTTDAGRQFYRQNDLGNRTCRPCVQLAVQILEEIL
jgi:C_GCAxxG_C_C family probable redox protein